MSIPPAVRLQVLARDKDCIALRLDPKAGSCSGPLECDHVRGKPPIGLLTKTKEGGFGARPPDDARHIVVLCRKHHQGGWATRHRDELREYLRRFERNAA